MAVLLNKGNNQRMNYHEAKCLEINTYLNTNPHNTCTLNNILQLLLMYRFSVSNCMRKLWTTCIIYKHRLDTR